MRENNSDPSGHVSEDLFGVTAAQQGVWYGQLVDPQSPKYNIGECVEVRGDLDEVLFAAALDRAAALCDSLNTVFVTEDGAVRQRVVRRSPDATSLLRRVDLSDADDPIGAVERYLADDMAAVDTIEALSHHFALLRISDRLHYWYVRFHHIAVDGLGGSVFTRTVADLYGRAVRGENLDTAEVPAASLRDLVADEAAYLESDRYEADRAYWTGRFADLVADRAASDPTALLTRTPVGRSSADAPTLPRRPPSTHRRSGCTPARRCPSPSSTACARSPPPTGPPGAPSS